MSVTFNQFNVSFCNESINFYIKKNILQAQSF